MNDAISPSTTSNPDPSPSEPVRLHPRDVEAIACRVVELLRDDRPSSAGLVSAAELACRLGVDRSFVYEHADALGARRLGGGRRPRLRFDPEEAERLMLCQAGSESPGPSSPAKRRNRRRTELSGLGTTARLLPIRGIPTPPVETGCGVSGGVGIRGSWDALAAVLGE
jgi:hypothetical protein